MNKLCVSKPRVLVVYASLALTMALMCTGFGGVPQLDIREPSFDVATIRSVNKDQQFNSRVFGTHVNSASVSYTTMTVQNLIEHALNILPNQVTGPDWTHSERFDIRANFPENHDGKEERRMLLALLKERFHLSMHTERKEREVYALIVGKHGEKLIPSFANSGVLKAGSFPSGRSDAILSTNVTSDVHAIGPSSHTPVVRSKQTVTFDQDKWAQHWEIPEITMEQLAERLGICVDSGFHKVIDETGIKGTFQVTYDCPMPRPQSSESPNSAEAQTSQLGDVYVLTRSLEALGLKVEKRKALTDVYVIDTVEKPSAN